MKIWKIKNIKIASGILAVSFLMALLIIPAQILAQDDEIEVIVSSDCEKECRLTTFEGGLHYRPINPDNGNLIPEMNATFPDWLTLTRGAYGKNPSPVTIVIWRVGNWAEVNFLEPVSIVSLYYSSQSDVVLEAYNELGELVTSVSGPYTKSFYKWNPISITVEENVITRIRLAGAPNRTAVDDFKACRIIGINEEAIQRLVELVEEIIIFKLPDGIETELISVLNAAIKQIEERNDKTALNQLNAFINKVEAQRGKKIIEEQADILVGLAQSLIEVIEE